MEAHARTWTPPFKCNRLVAASLHCLGQLTSDSSQSQGPGYGGMIMSARSQTLHPTVEAPRNENPLLSLLGYSLRLSRLIERRRRSIASSPVFSFLLCVHRG